MERHKIELIGQAIGGGIVGALGFVWIAHLGNDGSMHPVGFGGALFGSVFGVGSGRWGIPVAVLFGGFVGFLCGGMEENLLSVVLGANWRTWSISAAIWSAVWCAMLGGAVMIASIHSAFTGAAVFRLIMGAIGSKAAKSE